MLHMPLYTRPTVGSALKYSDTILLVSWIIILTMTTSVTDLTSRLKRDLRQACNMASSRPLRPKEAGSNSLLCSLPLKHRVDLDTNEFPKMFKSH